MTWPNEPDIPAGNSLSPVRPDAMRDSIGPQITRTGNAAAIALRSCSQFNFCRWILKKRASSGLP